MYITVTARGCLPPGANVCVAAPANHISSAILQDIFQDFGHRHLNQPLEVPSILFPVITASPLPSDSRTLLLPSIRSRPLKSSYRRSGVCKLPAVWGGYEPQPKLNLV